MKKYFMLLLVVLLVLSAGMLAGCDEPAETADTAPITTDTPEQDAQNDGSTFENNVLTTPRFVIDITEYRVIQPGDEGNEFGDDPVIAFWFSVTNLTDEELNAGTAWIMTMDAFQDNDPNMENPLEVGLLPDQAFLETQMANIREGGTVEHAVAYILTDEVTPVELVASEDLGITTVGSQIFNIE